jgi:divalent metal cation (Fe/Co/Zn/Cd) transporter
MKESLRGIPVMMVVAIDRARTVQNGKRLEYFTIFWNSLEAIIAIVSGFLAGSVALVGFGFDSLIEVTSGVALLWRLHTDHDDSRREEREKRALQIVGVSFLALSAYVAYDAIATLLSRETPEHSIPGIVIAVLSLVVMPLLARAKRKVARSIASAAMTADAKQTELCTYLSAILLGGLVLNAAFGFWWADPIAALIMVPIIAQEGVEAIQGKACGCGEGACH